MGASNVNLNTVGISGNLGKIPVANLGIPVAIVMVPVNTVIPATSMTDNATFATYVNGNFINDTRSSQWFALTNLDKFSDETKKTASEDTGIYQFDIYSFPAKFMFRYMQGIANYIEMTQFRNCQGKFDIFVIDSNGTWWGTYDSTGGLAAYSLAQLFVPNWNPKTVSTDSAFFVTITLAAVKQMNDNFKFYEANYTSSSIAMLENVVLTDVSATIGASLAAWDTTTDMVVIAKYGQDTQDLINDYGTVLTKACFVATDLNTSATLTISTMTFGTIVSGGQTYNYGYAVLSAAPTTTHKVQIAMAAPSVVNGIVTAKPNVVNTPNNLAGTNGQYCAVKTF
jgi:hypothetical protein